ncbi:MAG: AAA family ATPase [Myxococcaceae bacterium]
MAAESLPEPSSITLRNVKQHRELSVDLSGRLVVLVGPNGVGKSTVLKALRAVGELHNPSKEGVGYPHRLAQVLGASEITNSAAELRLIRSWLAPTGPASIDVGFTDGLLHLELATEMGLSALMPPGYSQLSQKHDMAGFDARARSPHVRALKASYLQPEFSALSSPSRVEATTLGPRGENLASVIAQFALRYRKEHQAVLEALQTIVPQVTFVGAATEAVTDERTSFQAHELELEFGENVRVRGRDVSEGTLIALAVLALAHHSPGVRYVLLDDIDRGLHPLAQKALVEQLRGVLAARPDLKIICTSHSPYLVEHFDASEVRVLGRKKNGDTVCKRLDQHPEWQKYKEHLDTGSYWASVGEEWVGQD